MEILKRTLSAFLALVLVCGMLPMPAAASEIALTEITEESVPETTEESVPETTEAPVPETSEDPVPETSEEPIPETSEEPEPSAEPIPETEPAETESAETEPEVTEAPETEPVETEPEETEPEETEPAAERIPQTPPDSYWYLTEETWTNTEDITIVEDMGDGTFRSYDTQKTTSGTYLQRHDVYLNQPMTMSLEENDYGQYYFDTFADLQELASMSFSERTNAYYRGTEALVIEKNLTLPNNLSISFCNDNSQLIVPAGVSFTCGTVYVDSLVVKGEMTLTSYMTVREELQVTGSLHLQNANMSVVAAASVTGIQNITWTSEYNPPRWEYDVTNTAEIQAAVAAANADTTGWEYSININTYSTGEFVIDQSVTLPENTSFSTNGWDYGVTIAQGCTLTLNCGYSSIYAPLQVDGTLVNNAETLTLNKPMTIGATGSYRGSGILRIQKYNFGTMDEAVSGLNMDNIQVTETDYAWVLRDVTGLTQLGEPYDLTWHKALEWDSTSQSMKLQTQMGASACKLSDPNQNCAQFNWYYADGGGFYTGIGMSGWDADVYSGDWLSADAFARTDPQTGSYYFTVAAVERWDMENSGYYDSDPVKSPVFHYTRPDTAVGNCTNLKMDGIMATWTGVANADRYEIKFYYAATENAEPNSWGSSWGEYEGVTQLWSGMIENYGPGYYSFQVRALSDDITKNCNGEWSERSNAVYLDPADLPDPEWPGNTPVPEPTDSTAYLDALLKNNRALQEEITLTKNYTLKGHLSLYDGGRIIVPKGITLTVNQNASLYIGGTGKLDVESGGKLVNNGYMTLEQLTGSYIHVDGTYTAGKYGCVECPADIQNTGDITGIPHSQMNLVFKKATEETLDYILATDLSAYRVVIANTEGMTISKDTTIPQWLGLYAVPTDADINSGSTTSSGQLVIAEGVTLTLDGGLIAQMYNYVTPGTIVNNGAILVNPTGGLYIYGAFEGNDPIINGGEVYPEDWGISGNDYLAKLIADGEPLTKEVVLTKNFVINDFLLIGENGKLIVPKGVTLTLANTGTARGQINVENGTLEVQAGGKLVNNGWLRGGTIHVEKGGTYTHGKNATLERLLGSEAYMGSGVLADVTGIPEKYQTLIQLRTTESDLHYVLDNLHPSGYQGVTLSSAGMTITQDITIPGWMELLVTPYDESTDAAIEVAEGVTVNVHGGFHAYSYNGELWSTIHNKGTVNLNAGSGMVIGGGLVNDGTLNVNAGSILNAYGIFQGNAPVLNGGMVYPQATGIFVESANAAWEIGSPDPLVVNFYVENAMFPQVQLTSSNPKILDASKITYEVVERNQYQDIVIATIPASAFLSAGKVKLTATAVDGSKKTVFVNITVTMPLVHQLNVTTQEGATNGFMDMADMPASLSILLKADARTSWNTPITMSSKTLKWASDNTKLGTVKVNPDGSAVVTIKGGQDGVVNFTATANDAGKAQGVFTFTVMDKSPRLETNKITVDSNRDALVEVPLVASYGNEIQTVSIGDDRLTAVPGDGTVIIGTSGYTNNATIKTNLVITCNEDIYTYPLTVTVKNTVPSITIKQTQKVDLFLRDSTGQLSVTAKGADVTGLKITGGTSDFAIDNNGVITMTDGCLEKLATPKGKPITKATLEITVDGYRKTETKAINIATVNSKPTLTTNPASSVINTALSDGSSGYEISFYVYDKKTKTPLTLDEQDIMSISAGRLDEVDDDGKVHVIFDEPYKGNITLTIAGGWTSPELRSAQVERWTQSVTVTHKVSVDKNLPTVKPGATTLKLSNVFTEQVADTTVTLSAGNLSIDSFSEFVTTAKPGTDADKITVAYNDDGVIYAYIDEEPVEAGTYTYEATPVVEGVELEPITVKVKVSDLAPKVTLGASTVKLNTVLTGNETAEVAVNIKNATGYTVYFNDFYGADAHENIDLYYNEDTGKLEITLRNDTIGKFSYKLYPAFTDDQGSFAILETPVDLTVQTYANGKLTVAQSGKGKLDAINPDSEVVYTIGKITNAMGKVTKVELVGADSDKFVVGTYVDGEFVENALGEDAKGKQTFSLKMKDGVQYSTKPSYNVKFAYEVCGKKVISPTDKDEKIKVKQSALKITAPKTVTYYMAQGSTPLRLNGIAITSPASAEIANMAINTARTSKELIKALADTEDVTVLTVQNPSALTAGKTYKLVLDITPAGNASDKAPSQVTINIKIAK